MSEARKKITPSEAAECLLRSKEILWDASRAVVENRESAVDAADVHDVLMEIAKMEPMT